MVSFGWAPPDLWIERQTGGRGGQGWGMGVVGGLTGVDLAVPKAMILLHHGGPAGHEGGRLIPIDVEVFPGGVGAPGVWFGGSADLAWPSLTLGCQTQGSGLALDAQEAGSC